jgi:hypothetical protein
VDVVWERPGQEGEHDLEMRTTAMMMMMMSERMDGWMKKTREKESMLIRGHEMT